MNSRSRSEDESDAASGLATAANPDAIVEFLRRYWGIPLQTTAEGASLPRSSDSREVVRSALASGDVRLVRALPCWVSLLGDLTPVSEQSGWSVEDRRRLAYICELASSLRCLRESLGAPKDLDRPALVAGIKPRAWEQLVPLCGFEGPEVAPSIFGERWGIREPMTFPEYVEFQEQYLRSEASQGVGSR